MSKKKFKILIVASNFYSNITSKMIISAEEELKKKPNFNYAKKILNGFLNNSGKVDILIRKSLTSSRKLDNLDKLIQAILRLAIYEINFDIKVPKKIVINEYLNISHIFFTGDESKLVNGILDRF